MIMAFKHPAQIAKWFGFALALIGIFMLLILKDMFNGLVIMFTGFFIIIIYLKITRKQYEMYNEGYNRRMGELSAEEEFNKR
jgi:4-hydroxybenzoate polyprenyltransferase